MTFWDHLPVFFRTGPFNKEIRVINDASFGEFLRAEYSLSRLDDVHPKLWLAGFRRPARSLSTLVLLGRKIVPTNALDMHLVWGGGRVYLKPLPRYLLEPDFWSEHLSGPDHLYARRSPEDTTAVTKIRQAAFGLLYTYACLIPNQVDLELALREGLIPRDGANQPSWPTWRRFAAEILSSHAADPKQAHRRFLHAELRLHRLNWIFIFKDVPAFRMYYNQWQSYTDFVRSNMAWIAAATAYIVVILAAMEVGLSTDTLGASKVFNTASYIFSMFSIFTPLFAFVLIVLALLVTLVPNWRRARENSRDSPDTCIQTG